MGSGPGIGHLPVWLLLLALLEFLPFLLHLGPRPSGFGSIFVSVIVVVIELDWVQVSIILDFL